MSQIRERTIIEKKIILGFLRRLTWPGLSESSPWPIFRKFVHLSKFKFHWDKKSKILWRFHGVVVGVVGGGGDDDVASQLFSDILHVVVDITTKAKKLHWSLFLQKKFPLEMEKIIFFSSFEIHFPSEVLHSIFLLFFRLRKNVTFLIGSKLQQMIQKQPKQLLRFLPNYFPGFFANFVVTGVCRKRRSNSRHRSCRHCQIWSISRLKVSSIILRYCIDITWISHYTTSTFIPHVSNSNDFNLNLT